MPLSGLIKEARQKIRDARRSRDNTQQRDAKTTTQSAAEIAIVSLSSLSPLSRVVPRSASKLSERWCAFRRERKSKNKPKKTSPVKTTFTRRCVDDDFSVVNMDGNESKEKFEFPLVWKNAPPSLPSSIHAPSPSQPDFNPYVAPQLGSVVQLQPEATVSAEAPADLHRSFQRSTGSFSSTSTASCVSFAWDVDVSESAPSSQSHDSEQPENFYPVHDEEHGLTINICTGCPQYECPRCLPSPIGPLMLLPDSTAPPEPEDVLSLTYLATSTNAQIEEGIYNFSSPSFQLSSVPSRVSSVCTTKGPSPLDTSDTSDLSGKCTPKPSPSTTSPPVHDIPKNIDPVIFVPGNEAKMQKAQRANGVEEVRAENPEVYADSFVIDEEDHDTYVCVLELCILPWLHQYLPEMLGDQIVINYSQGPNDDQRLLYISTPEDREVDQEMKEEVLQCLGRLLPKSKPEISVQFCKGGIHRCSGGKNDRYWALPTMGDSIGAQGSDIVGTLGPCLKFGDESRWMSNEHVFGSEAENQFVRHPNGDSCVQLPDGSVVETICIGRVQKRYGIDRRRSSHPYWESRIELAGRFGPSAREKAAKVVEQDRFYVKDVCLISLEATGRPLDMRGSPMAHAKCNHIKKISRIRPGAKIRMTGRTSGLWSSGRVGRCPDSLFENGHWTREWTVEQLGGDPWIDGTGIGARGDSGAGVVHEDDNSLCSLLWGRNHGESPLKAYITDIIDLEEALHYDDPLLGAMGLLECNCLNAVETLTPLSTHQTFALATEKEILVSHVQLGINLKNALKEEICLEVEDGYPQTIISSTMVVEGESEIMDDPHHVIRPDGQAAPETPLSSQVLSASSNGQVTFVDSESISLHSLDSLLSISSFFGISSNSSIMSYQRTGSIDLVGEKIISQALLDSKLSYLYLNSILNIPREKLLRKLIRLIRVFAHALLNEARTESNTSGLDLASAFVKRRARNLAYWTCHYLEGRRRIAAGFEIPSLSQTPHSPSLNLTKPVNTNIPEQSALSVVSRGVVGWLGNNSNDGSERIKTDPESWSESSEISSEESDLDEEEEAQWLINTIAISKAAKDFQANLKVFFTSAVESIEGVDGNINRIGNQKKLEATQ
jgi:hypothetical protein